MTDGSLTGAGNPRLLAYEKIFSAGSDWVSVRDSGIAPLHVSKHTSSEAEQEEFCLGYQALRLSKLPPQSLTIADTLNLNNETTVICIPRRASKTTSVIAVLLGRMLQRDGYMVGFTAQTQVKARKRLIDDIIRPLERQWEKTDESAPFKWGVAPGNTYVECRATGSRITAVPPTEDAARGDAYNVFVIDEAQEVDKATGESLIGAVMPTFDTVDGGGQLIMLGTAGEQRSGLLWDTLELGRAGQVAICEYAAPEGTELPDVDDPEAELEGTTSDEAVWLLAHPGIGTLTTLDVMRRRHAQLTPQSWAREYLGRWPEGHGSRLLPAELWEACRAGATPPELPARFTLAISVDRDDLWGAVVAVWRDELGLAHMTVLDDRAGSTWMAKVVREISTKYRVPIIYDGSVPAVRNVMDAAAVGGRIRTEKQTFLDVASAAQLMVRELKGRRLRHYTQPALDGGASHAIKRTTTDRWLFGSDDRGNAEASIVAIEAASMALRMWDQKPPKERKKITNYVV